MAGRKPDQPGTYRIRPKGDGYQLSGKKLDGTRIKIPVSSEHEGRTLAERLFPNIQLNVSTSERLPDAARTILHKAADTAVDSIDDWGLFGVKRVDVAQAQASASSFGMGAVQTPKPSGVDPSFAAKEKEEAAKQEKRKKNAKSLMELSGMAWAAGDVYLARRITESAGKEPVNPSPKHVNELADSVKDTLTEWFGDREIAPWQMAILLTLSIPAAMLLQSRKKPELPKATSAESSPPPGNLKSV